MFISASDLTFVLNGILGKTNLKLFQVKFFLPLGASLLFFQESMHKR